MPNVYIRLKYIGILHVPEMQHTQTLSVNWP